MFDSWLSRAATRVAIVSSDVSTAEAFLRRLELNLRTPDALNIAVTTRLHASLATFDNKMALAARKLGLEILAL
jgi:predicted nucleic acid-binding protein